MHYQPIRFIRRVDLLYQTAIPVSYAGPGDVVSSAFAWWGLRAYSKAAAGGNAVRIRRVSDNSEQNFATLATGNLDTASIATFLTSTSGRIVTLFDQTGNGRDITQATAASQPEYTANGIGSLSVISYTVASADFLANTSWPSFSQPFTFSVVYRPESLNSGRIMCITNNDIELYESGSTIQIYAGVVGVNLSASNNTWYGAVGVFDGTGSDLYLNAASTTGSSGTGASVGTTNLVIGALDTSANFPIEGKLPEAGVWTSGFSSTQAANLIANQQAYWGF